MEEMVVKMTKALMLHATDLFDITNSQVMILVETPSGERVWSANGRLRNEFNKEGRISNRSWGMKEIVVDSSLNSSSLDDVDKRPESPPASRQRTASPAKPSASAAASAPAANPSSSTSGAAFPRNAHEFLQQQQRQLAMAANQQRLQQPPDQKREGSNSLRPEEESMAAKRARLNQNGSLAAASQAGSGNGMPTMASRPPMASMAATQSTPSSGPQFPLSFSAPGPNLPPQQSSLSRAFPSLSIAMSQPQPSASQPPSAMSFVPSQSDPQLRSVPVMSSSAAPPSNNAPIPQISAQRPPQSSLPGMAGKPGMPNNMAGVPNNMAGVPNNMAGMPNNMAGMPNNMAGMPNNMAGMPNNMAGMPNNMAGMPNNMAGVPNNMAGMPDSMAGMPNMAGMQQMMGGMPSRPYPVFPGALQQQQLPIQQQQQQMPRQQQPHPGASAYDPSQPTEEPAPLMFNTPEAEKNFVAAELDKLSQAGKIRFSWLEIERAFVVIRRDSTGHGDIVKRVAGHKDLLALKSDLK